MAVIVDRCIFAGMTAIQQRSFYNVILFPATASKRLTIGTMSGTHRPEMGVTYPSSLATSPLFGQIIRNNNNAEIVSF
jgi:hypothetical protein